MCAGRALGDRWVARYGGSRVLATLGGIAAVGMGCALALGRPWAAVAGFATLGIGLSCIVPLALSAAARTPGVHPGHAIAAIGTAGWAGFLLGPPLIGALAQGTSLPAALILLPVLCAGIVAAATAARSSSSSTPP
jgi:asparagine N-glycosylation enzyme membrane subunit Stt3